MADSYICPTCDNEVIVGKPCKVCSKITPFKKPRKKVTKKKSVKKTAKKPWEQDEMYDSLDLPDDDFDYDKFVAQEFGDPEKPAHKRIGIAWYWWLTAFFLSALWIMTLLAKS